MFCTDCSQLVLDVLAHRGLNPSTCDVHCGFDGGQSILKFALTVTDRLEGEKRGRSHYSDVSEKIYLKVTKICQSYLLIPGTGMKDSDQCWSNHNISDLFQICSP